MEDKTTQLLEELIQKVDLLNEITIKNGGGRHITFRRSEFFQMLYDRGSIPKMGDKLVKVAIGILTVLQIYNLFK